MPVRILQGGTEKRVMTTRAERKEVTSDLEGLLALYEYTAEIHSFMVFDHIAIKAGYQYTIVNAPEHTLSI